MKHSDFLSLILYIMDLPGPIHDFLLVFLGTGLIVGGLGVVLFNNTIFAAFSLGLVLVCISLWYGIIWTTKSNQILEQDLLTTSQQIGIHLSTNFFLPFELISIILLVALIGAIAIARH